MHHPSEDEEFKPSCAVSPSSRGGRLAGHDVQRHSPWKLFRTGNERLHDLLEGHVDDSTPVPFLCECAAEHCQGRVEIQLAEWEAVAARPNHYLMVAGHPRSEGEQILGSVGEYDLVQKPD
ncbi:MAG TPA: hypothetical protein VEP28_12495 [Rubrobacter sp.]|nr:hypothetical protein [Rubrobacter sp.]